MLGALESTPIEARVELPVSESMQCLMNPSYIRGGTMLLFRDRIGYIGSSKHQFSREFLVSI